MRLRILFSVGIALDRGRVLTGRGMRRRSLRPMLRRQLRLGRADFRGEAARIGRQGLRAPIGSIRIRRALRARQGIAQSDQ